MWHISKKDCIYKMRQEFGTNNVLFDVKKLNNKFEISKEGNVVITFKTLKACADYIRNLD
jgi:hypothetical protein